MNISARPAASDALDCMSIGAPAQGLLSSRRSISYHTVDIQGFKVFYREAGPAHAPTVLLLHGFPSSSRMWEPLPPLLADKYHLVAPDYPGFGHSSAPSPSRFAYTFDNLARVINDLTVKLGIANYVLFMQDYGGPVGFRVALSHPERVNAIIVQNAVAHEQGLSPLWDARKKYWADPARELENLKANFTSFEATRQRHVGSSPHPDRYDPDTRTDEYAFLSRPGQADIQAALFWITGPTSPPIRSGKSGFARRSRQLWSFGDNTTLPSPLSARLLTPTMCREPKSTSWKQDIS